MTDAFHKGVAQERANKLSLPELKYSFAMKILGVRENTRHLESKKRNNSAHYEDTITMGMEAIRDTVTSEPSLTAYADEIEKRLRAEDLDGLKNYLSSLLSFFS